MVTDAVPPLAGTETLVGDTVTEQLGSVGDPLSQPITSATAAVAASRTTDGEA